MPRLFYLNKHSQPVFLVNSKPRNYSQGGFIRYTKQEEKSAHPDYDDEDTLYTLLEEGSLVIPRPVVERGYIDDYIRKGGMITDGNQIKDKNKLVPTIVMPREIIVQKKYAPQVIKYLKQRGITLPLEDKDFI